MIHRGKAGRQVGRQLGPDTQICETCILRR
jgi:hypothetical protein